MSSPNGSSGKVIHLNPGGRKGLAASGGHGAARSGQAPRSIAITSGKGGVGKTNIVANLGYSLARTGKSVLVFDADLGLGNLDVLLGLAPRFNLSHVIQGQADLEQIVVAGPGGMKILPASSGIQEMTSLSRSERSELSRQLKNFVNRFDVLLIDTAAGISGNVLHFNISADDVMVVVNPEPTSITDAYALMKVLSVQYGLERFNLLVNAARDAREAEEVCRQLCLVSDRFLRIEIDYLGFVPFDENVKAAVKKQTIISEFQPDSGASRSFVSIARRIAYLQPMLAAGQCPRNPEIGDLLI